MSMFKTMSHPKPPNPKCNFAFSTHNKEESTIKFLFKTTCLISATLKQKRRVNVCLAINIKLVRFMNFFTETKQSVLLHQRLQNLNVPLSIMQDPTWKKPLPRDLLQQRNKKSS